jgi:ABC-type cobalamin/Fe3+-siderophores transport system ATPase subunit
VILNIRGTNGSGKTTLARSLLDPLTTCDIVLDGIKCTTDGAERIALIGPYLNKKTGGCDCISGFDNQRRAITIAAILYPHVVFEGVIVAGTYGSWAAYDDARGQDITWAFLNTPIEECLRRIYARNGGKAFKEELVVSKMQGVNSARRKALAADRDVMDLHWLDDNTAQLKGMML